MENKKNNPETDLTDETLDKVAGGISRRPAQQQTKKCAMDGCTNQIPEDKSPGYCDACLEKCASWESTRLFDAKKENDHGKSKTERNA